ncbi:hypothetical protein Desku_0708 [Desulfofundulus kuznetsovii DSM 6115]|uniref:Uncharacterized protein n=1 Tax=Desulfofundulus kuznetsovii (strain DSM 6115 / VKM B-1805 / 17) TaxID=760568 RepID=A0AAU8PBB1_DESK7|nr:hypothetical protein Desku_0708 [Desulfofundulus kuznetsovii DSM 6115]
MAAVSHETRDTESAEQQRKRGSGCKIACEAYQSGARKRQALVNGRQVLIFRIEQKACQKNIAELSLK